MKIDLEQMKLFLSDAEGLKVQLQNNIYNQNERISTIIQNIGSSNLAYNSFVFANNVESVTKDCVTLLDSVIEFLEEQINSYFIISANTEEKISDLISKISEGISAAGKLDRNGISNPIGE